MAKTAVITGSAQGIGKAIATRLGNDGFKIVISDLQEDKASETAQELKDNGIEAISIPANVSKRDDMFQLVEKATEAFGSVDVFVNNAGVDQVAPILEVNEDDLNKIFSINVNGTVFGMQAAAEQMKKQGGGKIVKCLFHCRS